MLRLGSLLLALLLLAYLLWGPAETDQPVGITQSTEESIQEAPPLTGIQESPPVAREQMEDMPESEGFKMYVIDWYDPVEHGDCTLNLRVFDAYTRQPVASSIQLWRLEVAANETWSAGDQLQMTFKDPRGIFNFSNLAEGDYRVYSLSARFGADSPPAFRVAGETTAIEVFVDMPREHRMVLFLYRPDGYLMISSKTQPLEMRDRGTGFSILSNPIPDWVRQREPRGHFVRVSERFDGGFVGSSSPRWKPLLPYEDGIPIGTWEEDDRKTESELKRAFRVDGGPEMTVLVHPHGYTSYAAVFLDPSEIQERLVFPVGDLPHDFTQEFKVSADAVPLGRREGLQGAPPEVSDADWWDVPVRIQLDAKDYVPVDFIWSPSDGPLPHIELKQKPPPPSE